MDRDDYASAGIKSATRTCQGQWLIVSSATPLLHGCRLYVRSNSTHSQQRTLTHSFQRLHSTLRHPQQEWQKGIAAFNTLPSLSHRFGSGNVKQCIATAYRCLAQAYKYGLEHPSLLHPSLIDPHHTNAYALSMGSGEAITLKFDSRPHIAGDKINGFIVLDVQKAIEEKIEQVRVKVRGSAVA
jgi:hypothetical protein